MQMCIKAQGDPVNVYIREHEVRGAVPTPLSPPQFRVRFCLSQTSVEDIHGASFTTSPLLC